MTVTRLLMLLSFVAASQPAWADPGAPRGVDFRRDVLPLLSSKCFHCHGPDEHSREAKLRLDVREEAIKDRGGIQAIVPGDAEKSEVLVRVTTDDEDEIMPPKKHDKPLTAAEAAVLREWIKSGAQYQRHWSFTAPAQMPPPPLAEGAVARNAIDHFIASKLPPAGLRQSPEAEKHLLIRRVALDLTGLPPSAEEYAAFLKDQSPDAYEKAVARLMESPHFGERWARMWLDLARYADSSGYGSDQLRMNIWPYRDWVINAFNRNLPYDRFTIEQLAGDLLPDATTEQIAATAFHRNTMTQTEGGTNDEEYRVAAVKDRVGTTMQVWMGLTANCAQCHTHKFDPISHKEYYQLYAIFNQTADTDRQDEAPRMPLLGKHEDERRKAIESEIAAIEAEMKKTTPEFERELREWEAGMHQSAVWRPLPVSSATTREGILTPQGDGSLLAPEKQAEKEKWTITAKSDLETITALRVEVLPAAEGRSLGKSGNAVLSEFQVKIQPEGGVPRARFVRIEQDANKFIQLAELQVFSGGVNTAPKGTAKQSSTYQGAEAGRAIDGNTEGAYEKGSVAHNGANDKKPWWELDLGSALPVDRIVVWNRKELPERMAGARLIALDAERRQVFSTVIAKAPEPSAEFRPAEGVEAQFAHVSADFSQDGWDAAKAVDGNQKTGWGFAPKTNEPHAAVFELKQPLPAGPGARLVFTLRQDYGDGHNLMRVRITATDARPPVRELPASIRATLALPPAGRSPQQRAGLEDYFRPLSKTFAASANAIAEKRAQLAKIKPLELPIMRELPPDKRRKTHILNKGNYMLPGEEVKAAVLESLHPAPKEEMSRLALARWIVSPENPLTARVAVNRFWAQLFGTGIVETEEDFGTQGHFPSHPGLLDWLAVHFQKPKSEGGLGWDVKELLKFIVASHTYRQSSVATAEALQKDGRNKLLSYYPRRRLEAEAIRDQALFLSGLLSRKIGGPSVYPPQPDGLWSVAFNGGQNAYPTSKGEDRYRRGLYTFWRRTAPNPTMFTFDAPSRETCTIRRVPTNTPLQALVTLNDPVFVECAQALARRIVKEPPGDTAARIRWALQLVLGRPATDAQVAALHALHDAELTTYRQAPDRAKQLAASAELPLPPGADAVELAVWTVVSNVLLNLDGVLMKN